MRNTYLPEFVLFEMIGTSTCAIFNIFGFPAVHVPMGLNSEGMPIGVQVISINEIKLTLKFFSTPNNIHNA